ESRMASDQVRQDRLAHPRLPGIRRISLPRVDRGRVRDPSDDRLAFRPSFARDDRKRDGCRARKGEGAVPMSVAGRFALSMVTAVFATVLAGGQQPESSSASRHVDPLPGLLSKTSLPMDPVARVDGSVLTQADLLHHLLDVRWTAIMQTLI